jgi:hypothetical protein
MEQRKSGLIIPTSRQIHDKPVLFRCMACGKPFYEGEQSVYERHVVDACDQQEEYMDATSMQRKMPAAYDQTNPDFNDVEWAKWIEDHQRDRPEQVHKWFKTSEGKN